MSDVNLKEVRRRTSFSFFEDGLWDLLLGIFLLGWGIGILTDNAAFSGIWIVVLYPAVLGLKRKITHPRIGYARIKQQDRQFRRLLIAGLITLLAGIFAFLMFQAGSTPGWLKDNFDFIFSAMIGCLVLVIANWWWVKRWYLYGAVILAAGAAQNWLGWPFEWAFFISGGLATASGVVVLMRFLRRNPKLNVEDTGDAR